MPEAEALLDALRPLRRRRRRRPGRSAADPAAEDGRLPAGPGAAAGGDATLPVVRAQLTVVAAVATLLAGDQPGPRSPASRCPPRWSAPWPGRWGCSRLPRRAGTTRCSRPPVRARTPRGGECDRRDAPPTSGGGPRSRRGRCVVNGAERGSPAGRAGGRWCGALAWERDGHAPSGFTLYPRRPGRASCREGRPAPPRWADATGRWSRPGRRLLDWGARRAARPWRSTPLPASTRRTRVTAGTAAAAGRQPMPQCPGFAARGHRRAAGGAGRAAGSRRRWRPRRPAAVAVVDELTGALLCLTNADELRRHAGPAAPAAASRPRSLRPRPLRPTGPGSTRPGAGCRPGLRLDRRVRSATGGASSPAAVGRCRAAANSTTTVRGPTARRGGQPGRLLHRPPPGRRQAPGWQRRVAADGTLTVRTPTAWSRPPRHPRTDRVPAVHGPQPRSEVTLSGRSGPAGGPGPGRRTTVQGADVRGTARRCARGASSVTSVTRPRTSK